MSEIDEILSAHRTVSRGWHDTVWLCAFGCVVGVHEGGSSRDKERAHQSAQIERFLRE